MTKWMSKYIDKAFIKYEPSDRIKNKYSEIDYMGFIQLCSCGEMNGSSMLPEWEPFDMGMRLPKGVAHNPTEENNNNNKIKSETLTDGYFIDEIYNTTSPIYQVSWLKWINGEGIENQLSNSKIKAFDQEIVNNYQDQLPIKNNETCLQYEKPGSIWMLDRYAERSAREFDFRFLVFPTLKIKTDLVVIDCGYYGDDRDKGFHNITPMNLGDILNKDAELLTRCLHKYNKLLKTDYVIKFDLDPDKGGSNPIQKL